MPNFEIENQFSGLVAGVDEAGRGPWVGPVVAACVVVLDKNISDNLLKNLNDSKKLSAKKRETLYIELFEEEKKGKISIGIGQASAKEIDDINILQATFLAMERAVKSLSICPDIAILDGNRCPAKFPCSTKSVIQGDGKSISIAAASIVAKVHRDKILKDLANKYPQYAFDKNSGYGTKDHINALKLYGIIDEHRRSYKPIREIINSKPY